MAQRVAREKRQAARSSTGTRTRPAGSRPAGRAPLRGSEVPTIWTPPRRKLTRRTTHGYECIQFAEDVLGVSLYPWQKWLLIHALELNPDGTYRFRTVVLLVGRQNGKSTLLQVWSLWRMYVDRAPLVIGTAQNLDIAEEQWQAAVDMAEDNEDLAAEIEKVVKVNGKYSLKLESGERYKVAAATKKGGRGLSGDLVIMDELREHADWQSWAAVTKTTMARPRPQVLCASNAGDASSVVLRHLRDSCLEALKRGDTSEERTGIFEWSAMYWAPDGGKDKTGEWRNMATSDRKGWAMANPSLGWGREDPDGGIAALTEEALEAAYRTDPDPVYRTECLCQWVNTARGGAFEDGLWDALADAQSQMVGGYYFGIDVTWDRSSASIVAAGRREDGLVHGVVVASGLTLDRAVEWFALPDAGGRFARRVDDPDCLGIVLQENGAPVSSLLDELRGIRKTPRGDELPEHGQPVNVVPWGGGELGRGTGQFYDMVRHRQLRHRAQPILDVAVSMAMTRPIADYWVWDRKRSLVDISPLIALTAAIWALSRPVVEEQQSAYQDDGLMFV